LADKAAPIGILAIVIHQMEKEMKAKLLAALILILNLCVAVSAQT